MVLYESALVLRHTKNLPELNPKPQTTEEPMLADLGGNILALCCVIGLLYVLFWCPKSGHSSKRIVPPPPHNEGP